MLSRRGMLVLGAGLAAGVAWPQTPQAEIRLPMRGLRESVGSASIPIAIPFFMSDAPTGDEAAQTVTQIVTDNLRRSGLFAPIDPAAFISKIDNFDAMPRFPDWQAINAQTLVTGRLQQSGGRVQADFRLWDVFSGQHLAGQQYASRAENLRRIGHIISDAVYKRLTGEGGYFDTRVVFADESGSREGRVRRLAVMDEDGANMRHLTNGENVVLCPSIAPSGKQAVYVAYGKDASQVTLVDIDSGATEVLGTFDRVSYAPRFSPDGQRIIMSLQHGRASHLHVMDLRSRATTRLTDTPAIDTAPSYAPDGSRLCFESHRGGKPQIYVMAASGGQAQRISFGDGSYSTPVWSPRGDTIAFTKQAGGRFAIGIMNVDGSRERLLTEGFHNEGPTFAPNGRVLMFFRDPGGAGGPSLYTIDLSGRGEQRVQTPGYASDPAWSPLLS